VSLALVVALCGGLGAVARFFLDGAIEDRVTTTFPVGILTINIAGSFLLGLLVGLLWYHGLDAHLETVLGIGFCGGFTTWSTASWETLVLLKRNERTAAALYALGGLAVALGVGIVGVWLAGIA
jgi:CrcB protein